MPHHERPHGEVQGLARRQKEVRRKHGLEDLLGFSWEGIGEAG